ncbi:cytochrome c oxidase assembly protein [Streptosporangium sandarakinum]|uniref:cytochrome c oxidase assembly protein n=1 Tax=Streptosporangium sandarakinum TaxID=1260955 RepID=UPI0033A0F731
MRPDMTPLAHGGGAGPWKWDVLAVVCWILLLAAAYLGGLRVFSGPRLRSARAGARRLGTVRAACFAGGLLAMAVALLPPLDHAADERLFAHMAQHMVLVVVAAPLLAAGAPGLVVPLTLPPRWRHGLASVRHAARNLPLLRLLYLPVTAWLLHTVVLWFWHLPVPYDLALAVEPVHVIEHLCFLGAAWLLWWHLLTPGRHRIGGPVALFYLFVTMLPAAALGAVLTLARAPLYPLQAAEAAGIGVDPLTDQQLAGLVMWVPADLGYFAVMIALFLRWMGGSAGEDGTAAPPRVPEVPERVPSEEARP